MRVEARDPSTADRARGEDFVNGSALPELEVAARGNGNPFTLTFSSLAYADRWFVRVAEYPAVGVSFAYTHPLVLAPGSALARTFTVALTDE
jgi:hypothetical protein